MFQIKQLLGTLLAPAALGGVVALVGLLLLLAPRTRRFGAGLVVAVALIALPLGTTPVANLVIRPLEDGYAAVHDPVAVSDSLGRDIHWVVVLGAGHLSDERAAPPARLQGEALYRLAEGIRLWRSLPAGRIHLSGWGSNDTISHAEVSAEAARALGVPIEALALAPAPRDTQEEARAVASRIPLGEPFFLVTGAAHLDRSMFFFEAEGLRPIPAPAYFYSLDPQAMGLRDYLPHPANYAKVDRAVHEYLGLLWARIIVRDGS